jgi:muconolactone delta-isomerase
MSKFLVIWSLQTNSIRQELVQSVLRMPAYAQELQARQKLEKRYHIVGGHGGAWIYSVDSNEELDRLLAMSPVYNFATYTIYALAEMDEGAAPPPADPIK